MQKPSIEIIKPIVQGKPIAVLGGGPSLPADLKKVPPGAFLISCNHHAFEFTTPHLWVYWPCPPIIKFRAHLEAHGPRVPGLSMNAAAEFAYPDDRNFWHSGATGRIATWAACLLGGDPVLLCGMDLYQGAEIYPGVSSETAVAPGVSIDDHLDKWECAHWRCEHPERIRAVSGPLVEVFGAAG